MSGDKDFVNYMFDEKQKSSAHIAAIEKVIEKVQNDCEHDFIYLRTGHNCKYYQCTICRKMEER